jgi:hypothetical protein
LTGKTRLDMNNAQVRSVTDDSILMGPLFRVSPETLMDIIVRGFSQMDKDGMRYHLDPDPTTGRTSVYLMLPSGERRKLGFLKIHPGFGAGPFPVLTCWRTKKNLFKAIGPAGAWGISAHLAHWMDRLGGVIVVDTDMGKFTLEAWSVTSRGKTNTLWFKRQGFEPQIFIPLGDWRRS